MRGNFLLGLLVVLMAAMAVQAAPIIAVGNHDLLPNTPGQRIDIFVSGGDEVQGLNFRVQVADGGPDAGGVVLGPRITDVDLTTGAIFENRTAGQSDIVSLNQIWVQTITTTSGTVAADGRLAMVTIDTTGFFSGVFPFLLEETEDGATDFAGIPIDITDGSLRVVPEPAGVLLAAVGAAGFLIFARRRRIRE